MKMVSIRRVGIIGFYLAVAVFITYPLITQLGVGMAGAEYGDSAEYIRLAWWAKYALQNGLNPFYQSLLVYPTGFFSATQIAQPLIYLPITALSFLVGEIAAFNLWILTMIVLCGVAGYLLCHAVSGGRVMPALIGGLIFCAFPAAQGHLTAGHVNPLSNYALPIVALTLWRLLGGAEHPRRWTLIGALALWVLALGNFTGIVYGVMPLVLFGGAYGLFSPVYRRTLRQPKIAAALGGMFVGGALLILPFYAPLIGEALAPDTPAYLQESGRVRYSADLLSFVSPSPFSPFTRPMTLPYAQQAIGINSTEGAAYVGILGGVLALIGVLARRGGGVWLAVLLGCMVFSLGAVLKVGDIPLRTRTDSPEGYAALPYTLREESYITLPYALFQDLPLIAVTRTPGRFNMTTGLALGVLAALGLARLRERTPRKRILLIPLAALILMEYQLFFPFPVTPPDIPSYFYDLATRSDIRAVHHLPHDDPTAQKLALLYQTAHHKPLLAGYGSRKTNANAGMLRLITAAVSGEASLLPAEQEGQPASLPTAVAGLLNRVGVDVLILHKQVLRADQLAAARTVLGTPTYEDERYLIVELPNTPPQETALLWTFPSSGVWVGESLNIPLYTPAAIEETLILPLRGFLRPRSLGITLDGQDGFTRYGGWITSAQEGSRVRLPLRLSAGFHTLTLNPLEGCTLTSLPPRCVMRGESCQELSTPQCVALEVNAPPESASIAPLVRHTVALEGGLYFLGYAAPSALGEGYFEIETRWRTDTPLRENYHLFFHLVSADGTMMLQFDGEPGEGTYPTSQWHPNEIWTEVIGGMPPAFPAGTYRLYAGWYSYPSLTRLMVFDDARGAADGLILLREYEVQ